MSDLKNVIVNALNADGEFRAGTIDADGDYDAEHHCCGCSVNLGLEPIEKAVTDHFLDREKVRVVMAAAIIELGSLEEETGNDQMLDFMTDRLIEGLAGGGSE